jgi:hypothetical protein
MVFQKKKISRIWWDGRIGHSTYLMFFLVFVNFILISYNFLISGNEIFEGTFSQIWLFGIIFLIFYFPISILIGRWHTFTQISTDQSVHYYANPLFAKMVRVLLDELTGKASEEEIKEFRKILLSIEKLDIDKD